MTVKNRTQEFFAAVDSLQHRSSGAMHASQLMHRLESRHPLIEPQANSRKSEFARMASQVGREINATATKLERLTQLAKKKSLFDDRPVEVQELTHAIKQDISLINGQIKGLEKYMQEHRQTMGNRQTQDFSSAVIVSLQSKLAAASFGFKDVLELRSQSIRQQKERRDQYAYSQPSLGLSSDSPLYGAAESRSLVPAGSSSGSGAFIIDMSQQQQLQTLNQNNAYMESRAEAIEGVEKTIADLATIFQQLTTMISAHDDLVKRIDHNIEAVESNVQLGQQQLLKYMNSMSSNRWLMVKIFLTLIFFFLVFVLFFA